MPRFAANLSMMFNEAPFLDRFALAAAAGFRGVEFLLPYAFSPGQIREQLQRHRLELVVFNMPAGNWEAGDRGIACDPDRIAECRAGVDRAIEYALALDCRRVHCMAGVRPPNVAAPLTDSVYLANLQFIGPRLAEHGVTLLIEAINDRDVPGFYLTSSRQAFGIMERADLPNLRFQYDIYHMQVMEGDLTPTLRSHAAKIGHVQLADTPGRHEPGTGEINYPFLFDVIDDLGYDGWIGCEYRPSGKTEDGLSWLASYLGAEPEREPGAPAAAR